MKTGNQKANNQSNVCQTAEYLQCAMQAADQGVRPKDIKAYCGCE